MAKIRRGRKSQERAGVDPKHRPQPAQIITTASRKRAWFSSHRWMIIGAGAALAAVVAILVVSTVWQRFAGGIVNLPPLQEAPSSENILLSDFAGSQACKDCHQVQYDAWTQSTHGRAGASPSQETVIAPFDSRPIRFKDAVVTPAVTQQADYVFTVAQEGRQEITLTVVGVIGGGHLVGGGTQGFMTEHPDGTVRFLPFDYSKSDRAWFCNTGGRTNKGWVPITEAVALADCGDWPPSRILGSHQRFPNCQQCHGSQINTAFDSGTKRYETSIKSLTVNCESCHGPGKRHIQLVESANYRGSPDIGIQSLAVLDKDASLDVCFQCHALKEELAPGYLPGASFQEHFSLKLPILSGAPFFADGRVRTFAYQQNHLYSSCYLSGSMTCVDCHDPHRQSYRDINGRQLDGRFANGQCLSCHASKAERIEQHTRHQPDSPGGRCVSCHMPYLQHPLVGKRVRYARSDHTIPIPRPAFDARLGIESSCQQCHVSEAIETLQAYVADWYGELKPHPDAVTGLLRALRVTDPVAAADLVLTTGDAHPIAQFAGLSHFFLRYLSPDMEHLQPTIVGYLEKLSNSNDNDVAALALASLHFARGRDASVRSFLMQRLRGLGVKEARIRKRWVSVLNIRGNSYRVGGDFNNAIVTYRKALEIDARNAGVHLSLGTSFAGTQDFDRAIQHYKQSLAIEPNESLVLVNMAFAMMQRGDIDGGLATYRRAIEINPREPLAYLSLGNAYLRRGESVNAANAFQKAVENNPSLASAHFGMARSYAQLRQYQRAISALRRGLEFDPGNSNARQLLEELQRRLPGTR